MKTEPRLTVEYKNKLPLPIADVGQSFLGLADEHKRFLDADRGGVVGEDFRLCIKEIKGGSIYADLFAFAAFALPFMADTVTVLDFATYLKEGFNYLLGKRGKPERPLEKANLENLSKIIEPIAKDRGAQIVFNAQFNAQTINFNLNSMEANAVQNAARREIEKLRKPLTGVHEKVVLHWYQARNDRTSNRGDRAIIESIHAGPVKAIFVSESIKGKMLLTAENPFKKAFLADVSVETVDGKPVLYRILDIHQSFPKPEPKAGKSRKRR